MPQETGVEIVENKLPQLIKYGLKAVQEVPGDNYLFGSVGRALALALYLQKAPNVFGVPPGIHLEKRGRYLGMLDIDCLTAGITPFTAEEVVRLRQNLGLQDKGVRIDLAHLQVDDYGLVTFSRNPGLKVNFSDFGIIEGVYGLNRVPFKTFDLPTHLFFLTYDRWRRRKDAINGLKLAKVVFSDAELAEHPLVKVGLSEVFSRYRGANLIPTLVKNLYHLVPEKLRSQIRISERVTGHKDERTNIMLEERKRWQSGDEVVLV